MIILHYKGEVEFSKVSSDMSDKTKEHSNDTDTIEVSAEWVTVIGVYLSGGILFGLLFVG